VAISVADATDTKPPEADTRSKAASDLCKYGKTLVGTPLDRRLEIERTILAFRGGPLCGLAPAMIASPAASFAAPAI